MSEYNKQTLSIYDNHVDDYINVTPSSYTEKHGLLLTWIDSALSLLPAHGRILEIGSAMPRDAQYMRSKGFMVVTSDGAPNFVRKLRDQGEQTLLFNPLNDAIPTGYDMFFANAVIPHFTPEDLQLVLDKILKALNPGGIFAFNVKMGTGDVWVNEKFTEKRYVHYWQPQDILKTVHEAGFETPYFEQGVVGDRPNHIWTRINARKPASA